jgi:hypothetical protein
MQAVEKYGRDILMDTTFLHLLSHRPREALKRLRSMQEGNAMQIEHGKRADAQLLVTYCLLPKPIRLSEL